MMIKTEQFIKAKDWKNALDYTERYLNTGKTNKLISYFHNLALYHTGEMPYRLFDYPQILGVESLYFPWNSNSRESEYGHFVYEDLGYINEAQRWEFEAMVVWGETAPHLINLAKYNIANNRKKAAQRFINKLKLSLFYKQKALQLEKEAENNTHIYNATQNVTSGTNRFANVKNIGPELEFLCRCDSTNQMAFEYLMSDLLLSNNVVRFVSNLANIKKYHFKKMPRLYEEALYIYKLGTEDEEFNKTGFTISSETEIRFKRYYELMSTKQMDALQSEFGNSYWFYLNYISPYGNKVIKEQ